MDTIPLFLDFDGILHPDGSVGDQLFVTACMQALVDVLRDFRQVVVVVSSSWREVNTLETLRGLVLPELAERMVDCTPDRVERIHLPGELWSFARHGQCWAWVAWNRPAGTRWVALDDQAWRFVPECPDLLLVDGKTGFTAFHGTLLRQRLEAITQLVRTDTDIADD